MHKEEANIAVAAVSNDVADVTEIASALCRTVEILQTPFSGLYLYRTFSMPNNKICSFRRLKGEQPQRLFSRKCISVCITAAKTKS